MFAVRDFSLISINEKVFNSYSELLDLANPTEFRLILEVSLLIFKIIIWN
jgi:hypothetical protein